MEEPVYGTLGLSILLDLIDIILSIPIACNFGRFNKAVYELLVWIRVHHIYI